LTGSKVPIANSTVRVSLDVRIEQTLRDFQTTAPGLSVSAAVVQQGGPLLSFGTADAVYPLYSLTKTVIAALVTGIAREKRISLSEAVGKLPQLDVPEWVQGLTIEDLLNHTSGLRDYGPLPEYKASVKAQPPKPWTQQEMFDRVTPLGPAFAPDKGFLYSNPGYALLVQWLVRETGKGFAEIFRERVAQKLGLASAFVTVTAEDLCRCAPGYSTFFSCAPQDIRPLYHPGWVYHGLVAATAPEAARMFDALVPGLLDKNPEEIPLLPFDVPGCPAPFYYHGLMGDRQRQSYGHNGGGPGYSISAFKSGDVTVCVICDRDDMEAEDAVKRVFAVLGEG
jgi:D-alanyl-D-alanine carboxypeptidase